MPEEPEPEPVVIPSREEMRALAASLPVAGPVMFAVWLVFDVVGMPGFIFAGEVELSRN